MSQSDVIFDVFHKVLKVLEGNNILATKVPHNMTHLFQSLDLMINKVAKDFIKNKLLGGV